MKKKQAILAEIPRLRRYALALAGRREDADELVQDCLERAITNLDKWRESDNPRSWLFAIMHNLFIDSKRRAARRPIEVVLENVDKMDIERHDQAARTIDNLALKRALALLSPEHREVLLLVGLEGFSYREASKALDIPVGTLMSRLSRGREKMRELMSEQQDKMNSTMIRRIK